MATGIYGGVYTLPVSEDIWDRVLPTGFCWEWTGFVDKNGYGKLGSRWAHRVVYELLVGPIPRGLTLDHLCRRVLCVNPDHLEPVTRAENTRRATLLRRADRCPQGHDDWVITKRGWRACAECNRLNARAQYARKAA